MKMITVNGDPPPYNNMGELHFNDNKGNPVVLLCYVQEQPIHGYDYDHFALISSDSLVDIATDINYHAKMSKEEEILPWKRESETAYHYSDISTNKNLTTINLFGKKDAESDSNNQIPRDVLEENNKLHESPQGCTCKPRILREIEYVRLKTRNLKELVAVTTTPRRTNQGLKQNMGHVSCPRSNFKAYSIEQKIRKKTKGLWT
jgi:hypothetical protein